MADRSNSERLRGFCDRQIDRWTFAILELLLWLKSSKKQTLVHTMNVLFIFWRLTLRKTKVKWKTLDWRWVHMSVSFTCSNSWKQHLHCTFKINWLTILKITYWEWFMEKIYCKISHYFFNLKSGLIDKVVCVSALTYWNNMENDTTRPLPYA